MLYLHQYPAIWNLPSLSPFCIKVETYLRMVDLPYEIVIENNPRKGPKGKMPVLRDNQEIIADSSFILLHLNQKYGDHLDAYLTREQLSLAHAAQRLIEESLYFVILYSRWIDPCGKHIIDQAFRPFFPKLLAPLALRIIRYNLKNQARAQGIGRHSRDEIYLIGKNDVSALATLLADKDFFFGDSVHSIDATLYAFLFTILETPIENPLQQSLLAHKNLLHYVKRLQHRYF